VAAFHPDHDAEFDVESQNYKCQMRGCKKKVRHGHRNNYSSVLKKLVEDKDRNARIAARVMQDRGQGHKHLIASSQLKHLDLIKKALVAAGWPPDKIWMLRGEENAKGLDQIIVQEVMEADEAVVLSTVAGEALDIPPVDRLLVTFPMRDVGATIQLVGRVERSAPGKDSAIVIDFREPGVDVLESQWEERSRTYRMQGLDIVEAHATQLKPKEESA
nr:hypothetical protein [Actinomycetota bacterium]